MQNLLVASFALVALLLVGTTSAAAQNCDSITTSNSNDIVILAEAYCLDSGVWVPCRTVGGGVGNPRVEACVKQGTGSWTHVSTNCRGNSSGNLFIDLKAGADIVAPHSGSKFTCDGHNLGAPEWDLIAPGITVNGGGGADEIYGTYSDDILTSYYSSASSDSGSDLLCGYEGNDDLQGDNDDSSTYFECLDGGAGSADVCDGEGFNPSPEHDKAQSCETTTSAGGTYYYCCSGFVCGYFCPYPCATACQTEPPSFCTELGTCI